MGTWWAAVLQVMSYERKGITRWKRPTKLFQYVFKIIFNVKNIENFKTKRNIEKKTYNWMFYFANRCILIICDFILPLWKNFLSQYMQLNWGSLPHSNFKWTLKLFLYLYLRPQPFGQGNSGASNVLVQLFIVFGRYLWLCKPST